jgi:hypothetical protein
MSHREHPHDPDTCTSSQQDQQRPMLALAHVS